MRPHAKLADPAIPRDSTRIPGSPTSVTIRTIHGTFTAGAVGASQNLSGCRNEIFRGISPVDVASGRPQRSRSLRRERNDGRTQSRPLAHSVTYLCVFGSAEYIGELMINSRSTQMETFKLTETASKHPALQIQKPFGIPDDSTLVPIPERHHGGTFYVRCNHLVPPHELCKVQRFEACMSPEFFRYPSEDGQPSRGVVYRGECSDCGRHYHAFEPANLKQLSCCKCNGQSATPVCGFCRQEGNQCLCGAFPQYAVYAPCDKCH
jgi:hypothetical protein